MAANSPTVNDWLTTPQPLLMLPDDANPAEAYPAFLISGRNLPIGGVQMTLDAYNRLNDFASSNTTMFRRKGGISNV